VEVVEQSLRDCFEVLVLDVGGHLSFLEMLHGPAPSDGFQIVLLEDWQSLLGMTMEVLCQDEAGSLLEVLVVDVGQFEFADLRIKFLPLLDLVRLLVLLRLLLLSEGHGLADLLLQLRGNQLCIFLLEADVLYAWAAHCDGVLAVPLAEYGLQVQKLVLVDL
jgi:hypothetical protein